MTNTALFVVGLVVAIPAAVTVVGLVYFSVAHDRDRPGS
ncbi:MAG: hypothetical protein RL625_1252 [Gemmatimonadota bacterium]|jgi:hypothetical protein